MPTATQAIFELILARPVTIPAGEHPAMVHLWWRAAQQGERLVQVYVDDELYDVTADVMQRELWLLLDRAHTHRIELLAVSTDDPWRAMPEMLNAWQPRVKDTAQVTVLRDETLAVDTRINVQVDDKPLDEGVLWPSEAHRSGFGALFGEGGFGFDAATGPGLGMGELGHGVLGADGAAWRWKRRNLSAGDHTLKLTTKDSTDQPTASDVTLDHLPAPARDLQVDADFTLTWQ